MKIAFLIRSLDTGGAERQLVLLAKELQARGHQISILVFYSGGALEKDLEHSKVKLISLNKKGRWDVFGFLKRLYQTIKSINPEILHGYLATSNLLAVLFKAFFPKMKVVFGLRASNMDLNAYDKLSRVCDLFEVLLSRFANAIISNSHAAVLYSQAKGYITKKMTVIANGIDTARFIPNMSMRDYQRQLLNIKRSDILIGLVGRLDPMKDHPNFLEAAWVLCEKMKARHENNFFRFVCVGSGPKHYQDELKKLKSVQLLGDRLIWLDNVEKVERIYNALDILCSASAFGEGFSNVIGEAMACGCPVIATDVGDSALIVGTLGQVVPSSNPEALANACLKFLADRPSVEQLRDRIERNFSINSMVEKSEALLLSL